jgi:Fic family protein
MMERLYLSSGVRLEWKGLDPTDEGQRKKATKSLLGRVNWKGTYQSSCDLAATRTEQFCEEMNVFLSIIGNDTVKDKNVTVNVTDKTMKKKAEMSRRQGSILSLIEINDRITFDEITSKFTVSRRTIARDIASLKKTGILLRVGSDKTGSWLIAKTVK